MGADLRIGHARNTAEGTLVEAGATRLSALTRAALPATCADNVVNVFRTLTQSWSGMTLEAVGSYRSEIADDGAPFEFCLATSKHTVEVQFYVEPRPATPADYDPARIRTVLEDLSTEHGVALERLRAIEQLFVPKEQPQTFVLWIGSSFVAGRAPQFKVYLNPAVRGAERTLETTREAMAILGFERAWACVEAAASVDSCVRDPAILCLDLVRGAGARVKVYSRHPGANAGDLDGAVFLAQDRVPGDAQRFYQALAHSTGPFLAKAPITELAFVDPTCPFPASCTLEFPLNSYVPSDGEACARVIDCLRAFELPTLAYERAARALAAERLDDIAGMHAHVTLRRLADAEPRIGTYFASGVFGFDQPTPRARTSIAAPPSPRSLCR